MKHIQPGVIMNTRFVPVLALCAFASISVGCGRKGAEAGASTAKEPRAALAVKDVDIGRTLNPDKTVADHTSDFKPAETIYASVKTDGAGSGKLHARWTFQDGQVVDETSQEVSASGPANTEFHIAKPNGWPVGKYQ